jgi:mRNA-degrading endonuclease RelE of RelBE toxin-antitoxin system
LVAGSSRGSARRRTRDRDADSPLQDRYLASRTGDGKKLKPPLTGFRLHCGDYRVFFDPKGENAIEITGVRNRREAYR